MSVTVTLISVTASRRATRWQYKLVPAGSYSTGGETVDLTAVTVSAGVGRAVPDYPPTKDQVEFNDGLAGQSAEWVKGTTLKNSKIKIWASANTEMSAGAYNAAALADDLYFSIVQKRGISQ